MRNVVIRAGIEPRRGGPRQAALAGVLTLRERRKRIFVLYVIEKLTGPEVAAALGASTTTVYYDLRAQGVELRALPQRTRRGRVRTCAACGRERYFPPCHMNKPFVFCDLSCARRWRLLNGRFPRELICPSWRPETRQRWGQRLGSYELGDARRQKGLAEALDVSRDAIEQVERYKQLTRDHRRAIIELLMRKHLGSASLEFENGDRRPRSDAVYRRERERIMTRLRRGARELAAPELSQLLA